MWGGSLGRAQPKAASLRPVGSSRADEWKVPRVGRSTARKRIRAESRTWFREL